MIFRNVGGGVLKGDVIERKEGNVRKIAVRLFSVTAIFRNLLNIPIYLPLLSINHAYTPVLSRGRPRNYSQEL